MPQLQELCELGQQQLMAMDYLAAEATLEGAEALSMQSGDWTTLARLYMPLQEARRQRRQRCGEGAVCLSLLADGPDDPLIDPERLIEQYAQGQLLIAGWGSIEPALRFRNLARERRKYVETYLAAVYPTGECTPRAVVIVPLDDVKLPDIRPASGAASGAVPIDVLMRSLPAHAVVMSENELPAAAARGTADTYARTMALWERLHAPFLATADATVPFACKIAAYRKTIDVDYGCELAHQRLSATAREWARSVRH
jgi:hypothetical protein